MVHYKTNSLSVTSCDQRISLAGHSARMHSNNEVAIIEGSRRAFQPVESVLALQTINYLWRPMRSSISSSIFMQGVKKKYHPARRRKEGNNGVVF